MSAFIAISYLGDLRSLEKAKEWIQSTETRKLFAGLEILSVFQNPERIAPINKILESSYPNEIVFQWIDQSPDEKFVPGLISYLSKHNSRKRLTVYEIDKGNKAIHLISKCGGTEAIEKIFELMEDTKWGVLSRSSILSMSDPKVIPFLEHKLSNLVDTDFRKTLFYRIIELSKGNILPSTRSILEEFAKSDIVDEVELASYGISKLGMWSPSRIVSFFCPNANKCNLNALQISLMTLKMKGEKDFTPFIEMGKAISDSMKNEDVTHLSSVHEVNEYFRWVKLADQENSIPITEIISLITSTQPPQTILKIKYPLDSVKESESAVCSKRISARLLAERDDGKIIKPILKSILFGKDDHPYMINSIMGMAKNTNSYSVQWLSELYDSPLQSSERELIIRVLSQRKEASRFLTLQLASEFETDPSVQELAVRALGGEVLVLPTEDCPPKYPVELE